MRERPVQVTEGTIPPFIGHNVRSDAQKADMAYVFGKYKTGKSDYVICWFYLAARYLDSHNGKAALVSTNSISQGESVDIIWSLLFKMGYHIDFGWKTFVWNNEATDQAHVHVVIIGFSKSGTGDRRLFDAEGTLALCKNVNGYLIEGPNVCATRRSIPLSNVPKIKVGSLPRSSAFTVTKEERKEFISENPLCEKWIKPYIGAVEFLNGGERYCLWLRDASDAEIEQCPMVLERVERVKADRLASPAATTVGVGHNQPTRVGLYQPVRVKSNQPTTRRGGAQGPARAFRPSPASTRRRSVAYRS